MSKATDHNVFRDLGVAQPEEALLKARLAGHLYDVVQERGWSDAQAAERLGFTPDAMTALLDGDTTASTVADLVALVLQLDPTASLSFQRPDGRVEQLRFPFTHQ